MVVVSFESRLADAMAESIRRRGGTPLSAPSTREIPLAENAEAFSFAEKLLAGRVDLLICMTGVGTRILLEALGTRHEKPKLIQAISRTTVVARGPKPVRVLKENAIPIAITVPEPNTWVEILSELDHNPRSLSLDGKTVAIQEYGVSNERLVQGLKQRKASVLQVPVYRWALPEETGPLLAAVRAIIDGKVRIALFTSAIQVHHLMKFASGEGLEQALREALKKVMIASIGPATSEALADHQLPADFEPSHPKMGILVNEVADRAAELIRQKQEGPFLHHVKAAAPPAAQPGGAMARKASLFLKACRREPIPVTPVWIMRQAGRYLKEYRQIRSRVSFMELCKTKELAAEVAIAAAQRLKADAAILFSDLLLIVEPMGLELEYAGDNGPTITGQVATAAAVDRLPEIEPAESLGYVFDAVRLTRAWLDPKLPLLGFTGAPFTLAAYVIEGGASRSFLETKRFMLSDPGAWNALMGKLVRGLTKHLNGQIEAGADAVQLFDSWVGCLGPEQYRQYVLPHTRALIKGLKPGVPVIHFGTGTASFLKEFRAAGGDVIGVDWRMELNRAWSEIGGDAGIQGNLDPAVLCATPEVIRREVKQILVQAGGRPGHIFNLGHGILPQTPEENAIALVEMVHEMSNKR